MQCWRAIPGHGDALLNRGTARARLGRHAEALADFDAILTRAPHNAEALYNRGTALLELERTRRPPRVRSGAGGRAQALRRLDQSRPRPAGAQSSRRGGRKLRQGDRHRQELRRCTFQHWRSRCSRSEQLPRGFAEYEWRWKRTGMTDARRGYRGRLWLGEFPLGQRTILLPAEQGLGDTMQFVRYAPLLARIRRKGRAGGAAGTEGVAVRASMASHRVMRAARRCPPMMSIARSAACRLRSRPNPRRSRLIFPICVLTMRTSRNGDRSIEALPGKRVALAWAGHARHPNDRNRSIDSQAARAAVRTRRHFIHQRPARPARRRCRAAGAAQTSRISATNWTIWPTPQQSSRSRISRLRSIHRSFILPAQWDARPG